MLTWLALWDRLSPLLRAHSHWGQWYCSGYPCPQDKAKSLEPYGVGAHFCMFYLALQVALLLFIIYFIVPFMDSVVNKSQNQSFRYSMLLRPISKHKNGKGINRRKRGVYGQNSEAHLLRRLNTKISCTHKR